MQWLALLDKLEKEYEMIKEIPITLITIFILSIVIAYFLSRWRYHSIIDILRHKIDVNMPTKDDEIRALRERINELKKYENQEMAENIKYFMDSIKKKDT